MGICVVCTMDEATSKSTTCRKCRAYIHRWGGEKDSRIAGHFDALRVRMRRMTTFAVVKDENVTFVDFEELAKAKVIHLSKRERRRARATVVSIKVAQQLKSQQIRSAFA